jgi:hypothetical protein
MFTRTIDHKKPPRRPCPAHIAHANPKRSAVRSAVEHVFARRKHRIGLFIRTIGVARARIKIGMTSLAHNSSASPGSRGKVRPHSAKAGRPAALKPRKTEGNQPEMASLHAHNAPIRPLAFPSGQK